MRDLKEKNSTVTENQTYVNRSNLLIEKKRNYNYRKITKCSTKIIHNNNKDPHELFQCFGYFELR